MKRFFKTTSVAAIVIIAITVMAFTACNNSYKIGGTGPGGGIIFYHNPDGFTMTDTGETAYYLEVSPIGFLNLTWVSEELAETDIIGTETGIGTGRKNTALILAADVDAQAAAKANDYNNRGKNDWFLPSRDELDELYQLYQQREKNLAGIIPAGYWSSSQYSSTSAYFQNFLNGDNRYGYGKDGHRAVRAVRAF